MTTDAATSIDGKEVSFLRAAITQSSDAIFMASVDGTITFINPAFTNLYGWEAIDVVGKVTPRILKSGSLPQEHYKAFWDTILSKKVIQGELVNKKKNGELVTVEGTVNSVVDTEGHILGFISIAHDITARKLLEKQKSESDKRLSDLAKNLVVGLYRNTPGPQGHFLETNPAIVSMFEADSPEEFMKHNVSELYVDPAKRQEFSEKMQKHGNLKAEELELKTLKGRIFWAAITAVVKKDESGNTYFDGMIEDISPRKIAEKKILEEQNFIHALVESMPGVFYNISDQGVFLQWNKNFELVTGYMAEEIADKSPVDFFEGEDKKRISDAIGKVFTDGQAAVEAEFVTKDGKHIPYYFTGSRVKRGDKLYLVGVGFDIHDRKELDVQVQRRTIELERMNSTMVGREIRMIELKKEILSLQKKLEEKGG